MIRNLLRDITDHVEDYIDRLKSRLETRLHPEGRTVQIIPYIGYATETEIHMRARALYESFGFERLRAPQGGTGHFGCDAWYARDLP